MWTSSDTWLLIWAAVSVTLVIVLIVVLKMHAFLALMIGSLFMGIAAGLGLDKVIAAFELGVGTTLGNVGIVLALGTMLGKLLAESGGARQIAQTVLSRTGPKRVPWAMALIAMIIGIPLFFEIGVVLLMPLIFTMATFVKEREAALVGSTGPGTALAQSRRRTANTFILVGIPALAGLSVLHGLVPPHPGPLIGITALKADLGQTLLYGLILAVPIVIIAGPLFGGWVAKRVDPTPPKDLIDEITKKDVEVRQPPGFAVTLFTVLLPVALMLSRTFATVLIDDPENPVQRVTTFIGDPIVALLISVLVAMWTFGFACGFDRATVSRFLGNSLAPIAGIIMIIGAGGGFKQMLISSGIGDALGKAAQDINISVLVLGWLIAVLIRLATGSATVATVTAAGIMAPIVASDPDVNRSLLVLAIGSGSLFFSFVNDAGFWLVKEYFGMTVGETVKTWSVMETIISVLGLVGVLSLSLVV